MPSRRHDSSPLGVLGAVKRTLAITVVESLYRHSIAPKEGNRRVSDIGGMTLGGLHSQHSSIPPKIPI
jgi:hypothetical protein